MIDLHSHLLPGVDDGSQSLEESLDVLANYEEHGITELVLTPHYIPSTSQASPRAENLKLYAKLCLRAREADIHIKLHLANELYIDPSITDNLRKNLISPLGRDHTGKTYLLVELPMSGEFNGFEDILHNLSAEGFQVVLAHPERYATVKANYKTVEKFLAAGVLLQCNLGSLIGQYDHRAKRTIKKLLKDNYVFAFGTDVHAAYDDYYDLDRAAAKLVHLVGPKKAHALLEENPKKLLA